MTKITSCRMPLPKNLQDFEDIVLSALKIKFKNENFCKNGRLGQSQDGVDLFLDDNDKIIGAQCKLTLKKITIKIIDDEIKNAHNFAPPINVLYICTTSERDTKLQKHLRTKKNKFKTYLIFWEDIINELAKDIKIFNTHFEFILIKPTAEANFMNDFRPIFKYIINVDPYNEPVQIKAIELADNLLEKWKMPDLYSKNKKYNDLQRILIKKVHEWLNMIPDHYFKNLENGFIYRKDESLSDIHKIQTKMKNIRQAILNNFDEIVKLELI